MKTLIKIVIVLFFVLVTFVIITKEELPELEDYSWIKEKSVEIERVYDY